MLNSIFLIIFLNPFISSVPIIKIKSKVTVLDNKIYLRDLTYRDIKPSLSVIQLAKAPQAGQYKYLYLYEIKQKLKKAGIRNFSNFKFPHKIQVFRAGKKIDKTTIMKKVLNILQKQIPEAVFKSIYVGKSQFVAPLGEIFFRAVSSQTKPETGNWSGKILVYIGAEKITEFGVSARFAIYHKVPIAKMNLNSGMKLKSEFITFKSIDITKYHNIINNISFLKDGKLLRNVKKGEPFVKYAVKPKNIVRKRHKVTIFVKMGNIKAKTYGVAMQNGALGEIIKVKNLRSGKIIKGVVSSNGEVTIGNFK